MVSPQGRRLVLWTGLAVGWILPSVGCQVEYAGMTLPSGKYMHDDVQYFPPGPDMPWANTRAATQRARMQAMGVDTSLTPALSAPLPGQPGAAPAGMPPPAAGTLDPAQNVPGRPTDVNVLEPRVIPGVPPPGMNPVPEAPAPGFPGGVPVPPGP